MPTDGKKMPKFTRRALLGGLGIGAAAPLIPLLEADAQVSGLPKRVCFVTTPNGLHPNVVPVGSATDFSMGSTLSVLQPHRARFAYLHGIDMKTYTTNPIPNDHPPVVNQLLTAADSIDPQDGSDPASSTSWLSSGQSIDQFLADRLQASNETRTKFGSIVAGVETESYAWKQVFSAPREAIFPEVNAGNLHARMFDGVSPMGGTTEPDPAVVRRLAEKQSVIDSVRAELNVALGKVGSNDQRKIEAHLEAIHEIEGRLTFEPGPVSASCAIPDMQTSSGEAELRYRRNGENMMDIVTNAFACDLARVAVLQWGSGADWHEFPSIGVNISHHAITHDDYEANSENRSKVSTWYAERFLYFIQALDSIPEGDGTLLDNTLLVWTSEHSGFSQHGRRNIHYILAGNLGGALNMGRFYDFSNATKAHNDVYVTIAQAMGFSDVSTYGKESLSEGPLPGMLA